MRLVLATAFCVLAFLAGCASKPSPPKDPKLQAREAYLNALAQRCERDADMLRDRAKDLQVKAQEKDLEARKLRKNARDAAEGKVVEVEEPEH